MYRSLMAEVEERMLDCRINLRSLIQTLLKLRPSDISKLRKVNDLMSTPCHETTRSLLFLRDPLPELTARKIQLRCQIDQSLPLHCLPEEFYHQPQPTPRSRSGEGSPFRSPRRKQASSTDDPLLGTLLTKIQELQLLTTARKSVQFDNTLSAEAS
jgi:hypothetical protein